MVQPRHVLTLTITLWLAGALAPAAPQETAPAPVPGMSFPAAVPEAAPPLPGGGAPDLDLVVTAQVAGWIEPCG
jgi:hypothetical protein